jgi:mannose-6-phosphate isomerase-like protein (cupin superfamily)
VTAANGGSRPELELLRLPVEAGPGQEAVARFLRARGVEPWAWSNGPGDRYPPHEHAYEKLLVCAAGSVTFELDGGAAIELQPGQGFVLPPRTRHAAVVGSSGCTCLEGHR